MVRAHKADDDGDLIRNQRREKRFASISSSSSRIRGRHQATQASQSALTSLTVPCLALPCLAAMLNASLSAGRALCGRQWTVGGCGAGGGMR